MKGDDRPREDEQHQEEANLKKCPVCAEDVRAEALICWRCYYNFETRARPGETSSFIRRPALWVVVAILGPFIGGIVGYFLNNFFEVHSPKPFGTPVTEGQTIENVRKEIAESGHVIADSHKIQMHNAADASYFFVVSPSDKPLVQDPGEGESDQIRIYDLIDAEPVLQLSFRPGFSKQGGAPVTFRFDRSWDVNGDGLQEVFGSFITADAAEGDLWLNPVVITWDPAAGDAGRYVIIPILNGPPQLPPVGMDARSGLWASYQEPVVLADSGTRIHSFQAKAFVLTRTESDHVLLLAGYLFPEEGRLETLVDGWAIDMRGSTAKTYRCSEFSPRNPIIFKPQYNAATLQAQIERRWKNTDGTQRPCAGW